MAPLFPERYVILQLESYILSEAVHLNALFVRLRHFAINFDSIERVLKYYGSQHINYIFIIDELFGVNPQFTDRLIQSLAKYGFYWWAMSRVSLFIRNLDLWYKHGLRLPSVGVEAMTQDSLDDVQKK